MKKGKNQGHILVPNRDGLVILPPWIKRDECATTEDVPIVGEGKPKPSKNQAKRRRAKERQSSKRVSGRVKCQRRIETARKQGHSLTETDIEALKLELTAARQGVESLKTRLESTTVRSERFIIEMDIEAAEELIAKTEAKLTKAGETPTETGVDE